MPTSTSPRPSWRLSPPRRALAVASDTAARRAERIESLLSARLFVEPQLAQARLTFASNLSGHLSLYAMAPRAESRSPCCPRRSHSRTPSCSAAISSTSCRASLVFEDEGHDVLKLANRVLCYERIVGVLSQHLS
jgi:hypothetical protein